MVVKLKHQILKRSEDDCPVCGTFQSVVQEGTTVTLKYCKHCHTLFCPNCLGSYDENFNKRRHLDQYGHKIVELSCRNCGEYMSYSYFYTDLVRDPVV